MSDHPDPAPTTTGRTRRPTRDLSTMGQSDVRPERPRIIAWCPGAGTPSAPILAALRAEGFDVWIGSRREPAGNFEVSFLAADAERVRAIIAAVDPAATPLTVGR
ncbi:hypothetical protein FE697_016760 [Mumia zhuanghuii]|uniref:Uncharacterized protein n=2 Tax=Mumia TaxID=1546255 RepID=A0ABW1QSY8_9ACTN|nr:MULTISPECIES: hypothetical protein [Mumia]KAA1420599.1 hypothetical protein FE697_016760 [Mumia zhuanghuii]